MNSLASDYSTSSPNVTEELPTTHVPHLPGHHDFKGNIALGVIFLAVVVVTAAGNLLVILAMKIEVKLRTVFNLYVLNLAVTDMGVALTAMMAYAIHTATGYWPFGPLMCAGWIFLDYTLTFASAFCVILISVDRYWAVNWSIHYRTHHSKKTCAILIAAVWIISCGIWIPPWLIDRTERYWEHVDCFWSPRLNRPAAIIISLVGYNIPTLVMLYCYAAVLQKIRQQHSALKSRHTITSMMAPWRIMSILPTSRQRDVDRAHSPIIDTAASSILNTAHSTPVKPTTSPNSETTQTTLVTSTSSAPDFRNHQHHCSNDVRKTHQSEITDCNNHLNAIFTPTLCPRRAMFNDDGDIVTRTPLFTRILRSNSKRRSSRKRSKAGQRVEFTNAGLPSADTPGPGINDFAKLIESSPMPPRDKRINYEKRAQTQRKSKADIVFNPRDILQAKMMARYRKDLRLFVMLTVIVIGYVLCWVPFQVIFWLQIFDEDMIPTAAGYICYWLAYCNSTLNPIFYALTHREFRNAFRNILTCAVCNNSR